MTPTQNAAARIAESREALPGELRGRRLFLARALWVGVVSLTALLFIARIPAHLVDLHRVCAAEPCIAGQLAPAEMRALGYLERVMNLGENCIGMRIPRSAWFLRDLRFPHS